MAAPPTEDELQLWRPPLTVELVPQTCWRSNVRTLVDLPVWDLLRRRVYREAGWRCEICGGRGPDHPVEAHEVWAYDDNRLVQRLVRMIALCPACHEVKHLGLAHVRGVEARAIAHLAKVNGWAPDLTEAYIRRVFETWVRRSTHTWKLDLSDLDAYLNDEQLLEQITRRASTTRPDERLEA